MNKVRWTDLDGWQLISWSTPLQVTPALSLLFTSESAGSVRSSG